MKVLLKVLGIVALLFIGFLLIVERIDSKKSEVNQWVNQHGMQINSIETHMTIIGTPFNYLNKGQYIYEVNMTNGEKWWVRTGVMTNDYERQKY